MSKVYAYDDYNRDEEVVTQAMVRNKLRRVLGKQNLDAVHVDLINILSAPPCAEAMLDLIKIKNAYLFKNPN